ncbi:D-alanyl-D-alanine carboxypeptidase family protein [Anaerorhabdus sp.]|uniref:D-alanyl-D-alanine carboxypeptidase family protein n=1 Tax=Anaerorhabdus sp. TaxID=1872524 RepID=UPI002FC8E199
MKTKRALFVSMILVVSILCFAFMNVNYDKLSRYPYKNEENNRLIRKYLNDEEIEYIIEYSIAPATFIAYIQENNFNIYHASEYRELNKLLWDETPASIVNMVERTRNAMDVMTLANYLVHYRFDEVLYWIDHGDPYNANAILVTNAGNANAFVDDTHTLSIRKPFNLQLLNENIPTVDDKDIEVDVALQEPLQNLCQAIDEELAIKRACGGLLVDNGYISYVEQDKLYKAAKEVYGDSVSKMEFMPGHSEHQLGLSVDFVLEGLSNNDFAKTEQYNWLKENAYRFGLVQSYKVENAYLTNKAEQSYHFRYVGHEMARYLHDNNLSLSEVISN